MADYFILIVLFAIMLSSCVHFVRKSERFVVFRFGCLSKVAGPGWIILIPVVDKKRRVNLNRYVPGWDKLSKAELDEKIKMMMLASMKVKQSF
jgi:regulator of protease activity HflC (stomatin/prohibitin superfamily)